MSSDGGDSGDSGDGAGMGEFGGQLGEDVDSLGYGPDTETGTGFSDTGLAPGGFYSSAQQAGISPTAMADMMASTNTSLGTVADMVKGGMNPMSAISRGLAKIGENIGLPADPSKASQLAIMSALASPISMQTGVPMSAVMQAVNNPTLSNIAAVPMGYALGPIGIKATHAALGYSPELDQAPGSVPSNEVSSEPYSGGLIGGGEYGGNDNEHMNKYSPYLREFAQTQQTPVTSFTPSKIKQVPEYTRQEQTWQGNRFSPAPLVRRA